MRQFRYILKYFFELGKKGRNLVEMDIFAVVHKFVGNQPNRYKISIESPIHTLNVVGYEMFVLFFETIDNYGVFMVI